MNSYQNKADAKIAGLQAQIVKHEEELAEFRAQLQLMMAERKAIDDEVKPDIVSGAGTAQNNDPNLSGIQSLEVREYSSTVSSQNRGTSSRYPLEHEEYTRYGRQLILPEIGLPGQLRLKKAAVLVVGVGGLGCPAAAYLAGAGVGHLGLIDGDTVEYSNLHRQILHSTTKIGETKVASATQFLRHLNPLIKLTGFEEHLTPTRAIDIISQYDVVLDCTDTPASRYLISDACVLLGKPLVSASALKTEGQLMVLNYPASQPGDANGGPCYRCVFPQPPPAETVVSCGEGGILGPVVGLMGVLQALEAIKIIAGHSDSEDNITARQHSLLLFSAYGGPQFRSIKLRGRKSNCAACSTHASITSESLRSGSLDYIQFCGASSPVNILEAQDRVTASQASSTLDAGNSLLIDVREKTQFDLCSIETSVNVPFSMFPPLPDGITTPAAKAKLDNVKNAISLIQQQQSSRNVDLRVICRQGNDSQVVVHHLKPLLEDGQIHAPSVKDVSGGLIAWRRDVDPEFPVY